MRKGFLALVAFAVFSVLAQPVCAALELCLPASYSAAVQPEHADPDPGESTLCCPQSDGTMLAALSPTGETKAAQGAPAAAVHVRASLPFKASLPQVWSAPAGAPPPLPLSYYARSARILR